MHLDIFSRGTSIIHTLDARVKLLVCFILIAIIAIHKSMTIPLVFILTGIILIFLAGLEIKQVLNRLFMVNVFLFFLITVMLFSYKGELLFSLFTLTATKEGLQFGQILFLRANAMIILSISLIGTISIINLADGLKRIGIPIKIVNLFYFLYKYISILHEDYTKINNAIKARGFQAGTNLFTYRTYANMLGMMLVKSFDHSQKQYKAMLCRGFNGNFPSLMVPHLHRADFFFIAVSLIILIVSLIMDNSLLI